MLSGRLSSTGLFSLLLVISGLARPASQSKRKPFSQRVEQRATFKVDFLPHVSKGRNAKLNICCSCRSDSSLEANERQQVLKAQHASFKRTRLA